LNHIARVARNAQPAPPRLLNGRAFLLKLWSTD